MIFDAALVRWGEIGLKGGNRPEFLDRLARNLRHALQPWPGAEVIALGGRFLVGLGGHGSDAVAALTRVFGVTSVSPARRVALDPAALIAACVDAATTALAATAHRTFRVKVNRADKRIAGTSIELERAAGAAVLARHPALKVSLEHPELVVGADLREEGAFVYHERRPGPGGLPVGSLGRALLLLSGGIDSPVAGWLALKRGLRLEAAFFHAAEFTGHAAAEKVKELARALSRWSPRFALHLLPFGPVQLAIKERCDPGYRTLLYRRMMHRIAVRLARLERQQALISGDNLGQVASQTLENLALTAAASELPLLRPLLTYDKEETIALAKRIGTFELSIRPALDCCTVFQPPRPRIRGDAEEIAAEESQFDLEALATTALAGREIWVFHHGQEGRRIELRDRELTAAPPVPPAEA
ncbi:MAG: tRNA 4-thiouridine(8) synthase ThiI [Planctomycetes bacterium]|nr:tRNA 4-thiouridine(8) synthase ThiI [Planctomycetota bacterium]